MSEDFGWNNPYPRGTDMHWVHEFNYGVHLARQRAGGNAASPPTPLRGYGEWAAGIGCCFFLFGVIGSVTAQGVVGKAIYIAGATLLGVAIVTAIYAVIMGPAIGFKFIMWLTRKSVLLRCTVFGGVIGVVAGAILALVFDGKSAIAMTNFGVIGTILGLLVGLIWAAWRRGRMRAALARVQANQST